MKKFDVSVPQLIFLAATRGALGAGVGLLAAEKLRCRQRRRLGVVLLAFGAVTTIPAALLLFRGSRTGSRERIVAA